MIIRIMGEGQLEVPDGALDGLNRLDDDLLAAIEAGDERRYRQALHALLAEVRKVGTPLPDDALVESDLALPDGDASLDEVRDLLGDEGLIPG